MSNPVIPSSLDGQRVPLSRERVLRGAVALADAGGSRSSLTMRSLAQHLGVKPMALYYHVANKSAIIDGIVDLVFSEIELPVLRRRLANGDGTASEIGPSGTASSPLGDRSAAVPNRSWPGDAATPRRDHRQPAGGGILGGDDRPRLRPSRQLHLWLRTVRGIAADQRPRDRRRGRRAR